MHFHIITLFPDALEAYLKSSIIGRAVKDKKIRVSFYNPRDFTKDKHRRVDRRPYGGGPGMVMEALPVLRAAERAVGRKKNVKKIFFSARGKQFDSAYAKRLASRYKDVLLIAGHYEGVDERARKALRAEEVSMGPYVLTGGELPALTILDATSRFVPGVLGKDESIEERRAASADVYTRPEALEWKGKTYRVPKVLLSGHHRDIEEWRRAR